ncbi:uncharacterized protein LOC120679605 isoform X1 [Panicum virgatum]|uniref:Uncharacterized protein n=1 Tax=Panicum virgatum TaxID=38727 RepID=A0A8T0R6N0_PANVG|nr:uncharacterized protein LOC120679605 isoform X1 [Panicum virgatum]XP_039817162.1 uncharacterized protein LOC120679605 isoform X1 [Panicum virgatum]XP_039817163.1 uncharacterized protein LOC120679605 isoform X1 [Panicum virgatum]KAG2580639.1 hypothetical protein PVAP13_6NG359500 [Panicum virgatum]
MAGRFLFQKLSSRMSRSSEPVARLASVWEGSIRIHNHEPAAHLTTVAPNNSGIHGHEGGIRTLRNLINGASAHPSLAAPKLPAIHGYATRYFNTLLCTRASSGTGIPTNSVPPVLSLKPEFVNSAGVKRTFSSSTSTNDTTTSTAEWDAKLAAAKAEVADWFAKKDEENAAFLRYYRRLLVSWCIIFWCFFDMLDSGSSHNDTSQCEGKSGSHCQAAASANPAVKYP